MGRKIPLPRGWNRRTKAAILQILALSHYTPTGTLNAFPGVLEQGPRTRLREPPTRLTGIGANVI